MSTTSKVIGFDIGGSTIRAGLVEVEGAVDHGAWTVLERRHRLLDETTRAPERLLASIAEVAVDLSGASSAAEVDLPIGIGFPAQMSRDGRIVINAPNLGWRDEPFGEALNARLTSSIVRIDNDLNVILLGEQRFGVARNCQNVVAIYPGTGIGGAVMVDGRLVRGFGGFAGEIGHIGIGSGLQCGCGEIGCAETVAGGRYIEQRVAEAREQGDLDTSHYAGLETIRVNDVDAAYAAGEPFAQTLWAEVLDVLSGIAATACALLNPKMVVIGGGVINHAPHLRKALRQAIVSRSPAVCRRGLVVEVGALDADAGLLGGAALALAET